MVKGEFRNRKVSVVKGLNLILRTIKVKSLYVFQGVTLLKSVVRNSTCHRNMTVLDRHGHIGRSKGLELSIRNLLTCVKDAYLEDDVHWVFRFYTRV